jgi:DeoR/GlpR family transcriptional regulator of sugar metabolism
VPVFDAIRETVQGKDLLMKCNRADDLYSSEPIMESILRGIASSEIVIADVTDRNANVFYELGIAHTVKDRCIILTQNLDDVPFDLRHLRCIGYDNTISGATKLKRDLTNAIRDLAKASPTIHIPPIFTGELKRQTYFEQCLTANVNSKKSIARYVAEHLLADGDSIILDAGTTCYFVAEEIRAHLTKSSMNAGYAIMTHNCSAFRILADVDGLNLFLAGGRYDRDYDAMYGPTTETGYQTFSPRITILAAGGLTATGGIYVHGNTEEIYLKRLLYRKPSRTRIIIVDHTKLGLPDALAIVGLNELTDNVDKCVLVTDTPNTGYDQKREEERQNLLSSLHDRSDLSIVEVDV